MPAQKYGPLISPDGTILYIINPLQVVIEAFSLKERKSRWKSTVCPSIPPVLSHDGRAIYTFDCSGALVRLDTNTSELVWRMDKLPTGFTPSSVVLADDDSRLLLSGQVSGLQLGYVYSIFTDGAEPAPSGSMSPHSPIQRLPPAASSSPPKGSPMEVPRATSGAKACMMLRFVVYLSVGYCSLVLR
jgi:hypothetical protein